MVEKLKLKTVGVKATDDYTLEVELEVATPYFLQLCALSTLDACKTRYSRKRP